VILGFGLDLVDIARMSRILAGPPARVERLLTRVFTPGERAYCDARQDRAGRYAARFAAKEAAVKALGAPEGVRWTDLEVVRADGPPSIRLTGAAAEAAQRLGVSRVFLTITHDAGAAAAAVILEGEGRP
jgi:holo-[acyl-carrier protein] synthase